MEIFRCLRRQHLAVLPTETSSKHDTGLHNPTDDGLQCSSLRQEFFISTKRSFKILTRLRTNKAVKYQTRHFNNETVLDIFFKWSIFSLRALSPTSWQPRTCCAPVCSLRSAARQRPCPGSTNTQGGNQTSFWTGQVQHWKMWYIRLNVFAVILFFFFQAAAKYKWTYIIKPG